MSNYGHSILVTGGDGVIGTALVAELRRRGHKVWVAEPYHTNHPMHLRCDVGDFQQVEDIFKKHAFDYVYHLAAEFGRKNGEEFYSALWRTNASGTKHILRMQEKYRFRLIFPSSSEVYGTNLTGVLTEEAPQQVAVRLGNDYAISKWVNEMQIMNSMDQYGTETVRFRFSNVYGPGEYYSDYRSAICLFVYRALHNMPYTVYTNSGRAFIYIRDAIECVANICENFVSGEVYNIANRDLVGMKEVSDKILQLVGVDDRLVSYVENDATATTSKCLDCTKATRDLGLRQTVTLDAGLALTVEWFKKTYGII
ncbi:MAG: NAD(P)-dependent oxidoreductase [Patescibacteria group bacterium]